MCLGRKKKKKRGQEILFSLQQTSHTAVGDAVGHVFLNADQKAEGHISDGAGALCGAYHPRQRLPMKAGGRPKLKLYGRGGGGKYNVVHQTKG